MEGSTQIQLIIMALSAAGIYQLLISSNRIKKLVSNPGNATASNNRWHLFQRFAGFIVLGMIPFMLALRISGDQLARAGVPEENLFSGIHIGIWVSLSLLLLNFKIAANKKYHTEFPYLKFNQWNFNSASLNTLSWIIYLAAYEFLLRGVLLFATAAFAGNTIAIALNLVVYTLLHISKGAGQMLGCIPLGLIICVTALATQSFVGAALIHIAFALSFESAVLFHKAAKQENNLPSFNI